MACTLEFLFSQGLEDAESGTAVINLEKNLPISRKDDDFSNKAELHIFNKISETCQFSRFGVLTHVLMIWPPNLTVNQKSLKLPNK